MIGYDFILTFRLSDKTVDPNIYIEKLHEKCDDALIGLGRISRGTIAFNFTREAESLEDAIFSAITDIKNVSSDFQLVNITEISFTESPTPEFINDTKKVLDSLGLVLVNKKEIINYIYLNQFNDVLSCIVELVEDIRKVFPDRHLGLEVDSDNYPDFPDLLLKIQCKIFNKFNDLNLITKIENDFYDKHEHRYWDNVLVQPHYRKLIQE